MLKVDKGYANAALQAYCTYHANIKSGAEPYGDGEFCKFEIEDYHISDVITSLLHLAQQLRNEGEEVDPQLVWERAWMHFYAEVLNPDDIEECRRVTEEAKESTSGA